MKNVKWAVLSATILVGCVPKQDYLSVKDQVDSLSVELTAAHNVVAVFEQVAAIMDSVDLAKDELVVNLEGGAEYDDYVEKMRAIQSQLIFASAKVSSLESSLASNNFYLTKLKKQIAGQTTEIKELKLAVEKYRANLAVAHDQNAVLITTLDIQETVLEEKEEQILTKRLELSFLEAKVDEMTKSAVISEADALFARAQALELAATRTQLAPKKKKETYMEALFLYERSLALGKAEAKEKVTLIKSKLG